ncbi:MAG TPA: hypothetical protein VK140_05220 [Ktedonobacteraceae bacterium]|nr:hypothetical protein [Ktedonobacteraceae bacterium]
MRVNPFFLSKTRLPDGVTLTEAPAQHDVLSLRYSIISGLADTASTRVERYGRSEIRKISTVDVAALRRSWMRSLDKGVSLTRPFRLQIGQPI